jgi:hypothetical protein
MIIRDAQAAMELEAVAPAVRADAETDGPEIEMEPIADSEEMRQAIRMHAGLAIADEICPPPVLIVPTSQPSDIVSEGEELAARQSGVAVELSRTVTVTEEEEEAAEPVRRGKKPFAIVGRRLVLPQLQRPDPRELFGLRAVVRGAPPKFTFVRPEKKIGGTMSVSLPRRSFERPDGGNSQGGKSLSLQRTAGIQGGKPPR